MTDKARINLANDVHHLGTRAQVTASHITGTPGYDPILDLIRLKADVQSAISKARAAKRRAERCPTCRAVAKNCGHARAA